tara:strand:+ start:744 stop:1094 length:351 start_codon:yes stop_codon:yes gene_type:complete
MNLRNGKATNPKPSIMEIEGQILVLKDQWKQAQEQRKRQVNTGLEMSVWILQANDLAQSNAFKEVLEAEAQNYSKHLELLAKQAQCLEQWPGAEAAPSYFILDLIQAHSEIEQKYC